MIERKPRRKAEGERRKAGSSCAHPSYFIFHPSSFPRRSFTLVELLVAITILAILGSAVLFASFEATEAARRAATRTKINVINMLLMERWESYSSRRAPVDTSGLTGQDAATKRLLALRELMKLEMPDRWSDVALTDIQDPPSSTNSGAPVVLSQRTALSEAYWRRFEQIKDATNSDTRQPNTQDELFSHQGAECLYMTIMLGTADGEARSFFKESDIGDVDGDGAPEFLDGWGRPIQFLRWAPGFFVESELMTGDGIDDHDPFDVFRRDTFQYDTADRPLPAGYTGPPVDELPTPAFRLVPLIWSTGPDQISDIRGTHRYNASIDPYQLTLTGLLGEPRDSPINGDGDENWHDNIHNHIKDVR